MYEGLSGVILASLICLNSDSHFNFHPQSSILAIAAGMLNSYGVLFYIKTVSKRPTGLIATLSSPDRDRVGDNSTAGNPHGQTSYHHGFYLSSDRLLSHMNDAPHLKSLRFLLG